MKETALAQDSSREKIKVMSEDSPSELQTEYEISLTAALKYMAKVLQPYVEHILRDKYKEAWRDNVTPVEGNRRDLGDPLVLLKTLRDGWDKTFRGKLTADKDDIMELLKARNSTFHSDTQVQYDPESVNKTIEKMLHLLKNVPASQSKTNTIDKIKKLRYRSPENVAEAPPQSIQASIITPASVESTFKADEPATIVVPAAEPIAAQVPVHSGELRVEIMDDPNSKWILLHLFDGDVFIGNYEKSTTKEQAEKKRVEIPCATAELRKAYKDNGEKPFIVEWNGKTREKRIKSEGTTSDTILGLIPECYWWTKKRRCELCKTPGPYCR